MRTVALSTESERDDSDQVVLRWTAKRKAEVLEAIRYGHLTPEEAMTRYRLSVEELAAWIRNYGAGGIKGL